MIMKQHFYLLCRVVYPKFTELIQIIFLIDISSMGWKWQKVWWAKFFNWGCWSSTYSCR